MNILSIDSSSYLLSVALKINDTIFVENNDQKTKASQIILSTIDNILKKNKLDIKDLNAVVFNKGPASFTGTRISASISQAIGYSHNIPAIGIPSLSLMAYDYYKISGHPNILCIKKAYSENVYWGEFNISKNEYNPMSEILLSDFSKITFNKETDLHLVSDCWDTYKSKTNVLIDKHLNHIDLKNNPDAKLIIDYALKFCDFSKSFDLKETFPDYANHEL